MKPIKIDNGTFEEAARILDVINPGVVSKDSALDLMHDMVNRYGQESAYFGTAGFYIVCFDDRDGIRHAKAVLMPYSVERYLKQIGRM